MLEVALSSFRSNITRYVSTLLAIAIGVAFLVAGGVIVASVRDSLTGNVESGYRDWNTVVSPIQPEQGDRRAQQSVPGNVIDSLEGLEQASEVYAEYASQVKLLGGVAHAGDAGFLGFRTVKGWSDSSLFTAHIIDGAPPVNPNEIVLDKETAKDRELRVGQRVQVSGVTEAIDVTIVGIADFDVRSSDTFNGVLWVRPDWLAVIAGEDATDASRVALRARPGVSEEELASAARAVVPSNLLVQPGTQFRTQQAEFSAEFLRVLGPVFQGFGFLAIFVCGAVILNTFAVIFTQRSRELALLRAIAATPKEVTFALLSEGAFVGVLGSLSGLALGIGFAEALTRVLERFDIELIEGLVVPPVSTALYVLVGIIVTVLAAIVPAVRASRIAPVEAMRQGAAESPKFPKVRTWIAIVAGAISVPLLFIDTGWVFGIAAFLFTIAVFFATPAACRGFAAMCSSVLALFGVAPRLAAESIGRNPRRSGTTVNALVIGVFLVTFVTISGTSLERYTTTALEDSATADFVVTSVSGREIPEDLSNSMAALPGVKEYVPIASIAVTDQRGGPGQLAAAAPGALTRLGYEASAGDLDSLGQGVAVVDFADTPLGSKVTLLRADNSAPITLTVTALITFSIDLAFTNTMFVDPAVLKTLDPDAPISTAIITAKPGERDNLSRELATRTQGVSDLTVNEGNFVVRFIEPFFRYLINGVNALLGFSVLIALIGIVNTITLSIFERRREFGLLRAVGMTARSTRRMVRIEAMMLALLGTIIGMLTGSVLAWRALGLTDLGDVTIDWGRIGVVAAVGVGVGLVSAIWPPWKATRLDILESLDIA